jgi:hypothetical protein
MAEYFDPNSNREIDTRQNSGLNPSSFLRPRRGRGKTNVQRGSRYQQPPRQEITPAKAPLEESPYSSFSQDEVAPTAMTRPAAIAPVVSDDVVNPIENNFTDGASSDVAIPIDPNNAYLRYIRNPYPSVIGENPVSNYSRSNGSIKLQGKYKQNFLTFTEYPLTGITETKGSYNFIIQFMDGERYTSAVFYKELELELSVGNPYRTLNSIATVKVDDVLLGSYQSLKKFAIGEKYAEMDITNNLNTRDEIIAHIDWLVGSGVELRDVSEMGSFVHKQTDDLGFALQPSIDGEELDPNAEGSESNIGVDIGDTTEPVVSVVKSDPIPVNDVFPPFGVAGVRPGELRSKDGNQYRWKLGRSAFGRRGADSGSWISIGNTPPTQGTPDPPPPPFNPPRTGGIYGGGYFGLGNIPGPISIIGGVRFGRGGSGSGNIGGRLNYL